MAVDLRYDTHNPHLAKKARDAQAAKDNATKIRTQYRTENGRVYSVYRDNAGRYFIVDVNNDISYFSNPNAIAVFNTNKPITTSKANYQNLSKDDLAALQKQNVYAQFNGPAFSIDDNTNNNGGGGGAGGYPGDYYGGYGGYGGYVDTPTQPANNIKIWTAEELADYYDIDYDEAAKLKEYNEKTDKFYDSAIATQEALREQTTRNDAQYMRQLTEAYLDSYRNAAPTATGKGTLAANTLSNLINASDTMSYNDYGMQQSINALEEERKAETANNALLAKDYYNSLGRYLSTLSANLNAADVKAYVADLDKYNQEYTASRQTAGAYAAAAADKYAGLAKAAATNAAYGAGNALNKWYQYYDLYLKQTNGNTKEADNLLVNNHLNTKGY